AAPISSQKRRSIVVIGAVLGGLLFGGLAGVAAASGDSGRPLRQEPVADLNSPQVPEWIDGDGRIDMSKAPLQMPLVNSTGDIVGYIDTAILMAPPPSDLDSNGDAGRNSIE